MRQERFSVNDIPIDVKALAARIVDVVLSVIRMDQYALYPGDGVELGAFAVHWIGAPRDEPGIPRRSVDLLRRLPGKVPWIDMR